LNRRQFLKFPIAAAALTLDARAAGLEAPRREFTVKSGVDRYAEELHVMGGSFDLKVSAKDTGGDLCIYDTIRKTRGGPALHRHFHQDEWFYVVKGEFIVKVGDETAALHPGDSAFGPRRVPHAFASVGEGEGQLLIVFQPAGTMEDYFKQAAAMGSEIPKERDAMMKELWERHGMEVLGPPLTY
jgi:mannose-6-phosphate isomerase-like protein (cupin superfamily)